MRRTKAARKYLYGRRRRSPFKMETHSHEEDKKTEQKVVEDDNVNAAKSVANNDGSEKGQNWGSKTNNSYIDPNDPFGYNQRESMGHSSAAPGSNNRFRENPNSSAGGGVAADKPMSGGTPGWGQRTFGY
tara:strand:- start:4036 stop:4425 length:390 start_codon:yes stop_codon:yes gene_type:complete